MKASHKREFVNVPDRFVRLGWGVWVESLRELWAARQLCWRLTRREVVARYRQSLVGIGWALITPLATVGVFWFLNHRRLIDMGDTELSYPVFLYLGLLPWQLFHACLVRSTSSLSSAGSLVSRARFARETLVLSAMGSALFDALVGLSILVVLCLATATPVAWTVLFVPLLVVLQLVLSLSLGLALAALNAALRDLKSAVSLGGLLWMFLTPVLYPTPADGTLLLWLNPMAPVIDAYRGLVLGQEIALGPLALAAGLSLVLLPLTWRLFHVFLPRAAQVV